ncbi:MAG: zinc ribbon domain-containing protein [Candidatus Methanomethylophilaceae archaeon]
MVDNQNFCVKCGQFLDEGARFCPACGMRVPGRSLEQVEAEREEVRSLMTSHLKLAAIMMLVYSIPFLIIGIVITVSLDSIVDELINNPSYESYMEIMGLSETELHDVLQQCGLMYIVSSVCGVLSSVLCFKRRMYWVAVLLCILSFLIGSTGFFALFMGLGAFWLLLSSKLVFSEYSDMLDEELTKIN